MSDRGHLNGVNRVTRAKGRAITHGTASHGTVSGASENVSSTDKSSHRGVQCRRRRHEEKFKGHFPEYDSLSKSRINEGPRN